MQLDKGDVDGKTGVTLEYAELGMRRGFGSDHFRPASLDSLFIPRGETVRKPSPPRIVL